MALSRCVEEVAGPHGWVILETFELGTPCSRFRDTVPEGDATDCVIDRSPAHTRDPSRKGRKTWNGPKVADAAHSYSVECLNHRLQDLFVGGFEPTDRGPA
jgi:hypothetical protein